MWMYSDLATSTFSQYVAWVSLPVCLILFAAGFVHIVAAQSIGSGIPEMKTILRGVQLKEYLTFRALISKLIGLTATLGSGLPLGKEGPSVHIASMVAALMSKMVTSFQGIYTNESRTSDMLAAACAVGVASCFAAPVGGVLFSIEVTTTYFAVRNYWRGFFAACCSAIMFRLLSVWSGAMPTVKPLFPTHLPQDFPFDPQEFAVFVLLGIVSGFLAALWVFLHRQYVLFMRNSKTLTKFLQKRRRPAHDELYTLNASITSVVRSPIEAYVSDRLGDGSGQHRLVNTHIHIGAPSYKSRFIYPGFMTLAVMSILFPPGIGKYMAADLGNQEQVLSMFANFTWSDELTAEQAAIVSHWRTPEVNIYGCLVIYFIAIVSIVILVYPPDPPPPKHQTLPIGKYFLTMVACTLPVPAGIFVPAFKMGACLGRFTGEVMHYFCPLGVAYGGHIQKILPGGYATVGAAAFTGAVTHTVSTIVIVIEMTGQVTHLLPIMAAVLAANAVAALLQPSCFDSIILIKKLPYLPDLLSSASRMYDICVEDFMVRDVKYIWDKMTFQQLKDILKENKAIKSFPLVDSPSSMVLLGSIHRWELVKVIEKQVGRERRLQVAAMWHKEAEAQRRREEEMKRVRRPSRFEVCPAPDILGVPDSGMTRGSSLTTKDQGGLLPSPGQLFRPKSILKKTNSFTLTRGLSSGGPNTPVSPHPSVYTTVTGAETRIRAAFEAIFKRSSMLQDVEGGLGGDGSLSPGSLPRSPSVNKKVQLPRERVCDMSPEDQRAWERLEMAKEVDFDRMLQLARRRDTNTLIKSSLDGSSDHTPVILILSPIAIPHDSGTDYLHNSKTDWDCFREYLESNIDLKLSLKTNEEVDNASLYITNLIQLSHRASDKTKLNRAIKELKNLLAETTNDMIKKRLEKMSPNGHGAYNLWRLQKLPQPQQCSPPIRSGSTWARTDQEKSETFAIHLSSVFKPNDADTQKTLK
ncbi:Chloride channel protein 2 [Eumeta japonica]|uniref:Chloride channel protein 2 n=1 Tax=Eumeta variegata TaxID=151549 RepID=A0A4C1SRL9_EUMVA|nr:Chloride channel protein 2 [Eumeta japonica]